MDKYIVAGMCARCIASYFLDNNINNNVLHVGSRFYVVSGIKNVNFLSKIQFRRFTI